MSQKNKVAFNKGVQIKNMGYSIYYNPYRNKGSAEDYDQFIIGYKSA